MEVSTCCSAALQYPQPAKEGDQGEAAQEACRDEGEKELLLMKVIVHHPLPQPEPPSTYDIVGLTEEEVKILTEVCQRSSYIGRVMEGAATYHSMHISATLNDLYHSLKAASRFK